MKYRKSFLTLEKYLIDNGFAYKHLVEAPSIIDDVKIYVTDIINDGYFVQVNDYRNKGLKNRNMISVPVFNNCGHYDFCGIAPDHHKNDRTFTSMYLNKGDVEYLSNKICSDNNFDPNMLSHECEFVVLFFKDEKEFLKWKLST